MSVEVGTLVSRRIIGSEHKNRDLRPTTPLTPQGVVELSPLSRSGELSSDATAESTEETFIEGTKIFQSNESRGAAQRVRDS